MSGEGGEEVERENKTEGCSQTEGKRLRLLAGSPPVTVRVDQYSQSIWDTIDSLTEQIYVHMNNGARNLKCRVKIQARKIK